MRSAWALPFIRRLRHPWKKKNIYTYLTSRPFPIGVGRDHILPLTTTLTHTFRFFHCHQILHTSSPVSGILEDGVVIFVFPVYLTLFNLQQLSITLIPIQHAFDGRFCVVVEILAYYARDCGFDSRIYQTFVCMNMSVCIGSGCFYI
jgi:hypothetical protein